MINKKTTIAINQESRKKLGKIKKILEWDNGRFVDMDEVIEYLIENSPKNLKIKIESL